MKYFHRAILPPISVPYCPQIGARNACPQKSYKLLVKKKITVNEGK